ncbi:MAG: hypothetical protein ACRCZO_12825, partial [Cetobacterium sp.]
LKKIIDTNEVKLCFQLGSFISLDRHYYIHNIEEASGQSLSISWDKTNEYIKKALSFINADYDDVLDKEEVGTIEQKMGKAPKHCYPIYIVTVGKEETEKVVYIGKTSAKKNRFKGGHSVALKLHDPKYDGMVKNVYLGCVVFLTKEKDYLPLEWIYPKNKALELLDNVESYLIYRFSPELNIQKKQKNYCKYDFCFHIQNFSGHSNFLNDWIG